MSTGRRYRGGQSFAIPVWNGIFDHFKKIGEALWEFLWCIDAVTREKNGEGLVLGQMPVKLERIVHALRGSDRETVRRHLKKLESAKYIRVRRTPYGQVIWVLNSKKFGIWKKEKLQKAVSANGEKPTGEYQKPQKAVSNYKLQIAVSNKDSAVDSAKGLSRRVALPSSDCQDHPSKPTPHNSSSSSTPKPRRVDRFGVVLLNQDGTDD